MFPFLIDKQIIADIFEIKHGYIHLMNTFMINHDCVMYM